NLYFFFQAEDGIRDGHVTGVQTCALPISTVSLGTALTNDSTIVFKTNWKTSLIMRFLSSWNFFISGFFLLDASFFFSNHNIYERSEERSVGKECRFFMMFDIYNNNRMIII